MTGALVAGVVGLALLQAPAGPPGPITVGWVHHGSVRVEARTRFGGFTGATEAVTGKITEADSAGRTVRAWVEVLARTFASGNGLRDADVRRTLAVEQHPTMRFDLDSLVPRTGPGAVTLHGALRLLGVRRSVAVPATLSDAAGALRLQAAFPVDLRDYGVTRLSRWLGLLRAEPTVTVTLDLVFEQGRSHH